MVGITEQIRSISQVVGREYTKPDQGKLDKQIKALHNNKDALRYLKEERMLTDETIEHFQLGYDTGHKAISIPIFKDNELVNIKYRYLKPDKLRYTSESGAETWIFNDKGFDIAKEKKGILVVEGEFDLMSVWQSGIKNVVSPASGKDSYGVWIEALDKIPRVYVAFDNDEGGQQTNKKFAERVGTDKCFDVKYPEGIKDANEYLKDHGPDDFRNLIKKAVPFHSYQFTSLGDVLYDIRNEDDDLLELHWVPKVKIEKDWLIVLSGETNVGKTSYSMNIATELAQKGTPTLILPFERGCISVGKRFLQVSNNLTMEDMKGMDEDEWSKVVDASCELPVYFATPKINEMIELVKKSKRLFDTKVVIIDHLDYIVRSSNNQASEIANTLQNLKRVAEENKIIFIVVTHLRKLDALGGRKPQLDDLKGSSSLSQDPECVILLSKGDSADPVMVVDIAKNKGNMGKYDFGINLSTGTMNDDPDDY